MIGAGVSLVALVVAFVILPVGRRWRDREMLIQADRARLQRAEEMIANEPRLRSAADRAAGAPLASQRLLSARTPALAASALQSLLQAYADRAGLTVTELDVTGPPDSTMRDVSLPATVSGIAPITGINNMLALVRQGPILLQTRELTIRPNPALKGNLLQMRLTMAAPFVERSDARPVSTTAQVGSIPLPGAVFSRDIFALKKVPEPALAAAAQPNPAAADAPVLYGTMLGDRPTALLRLNREGAQSYREGDVAGGYRIEKINEGSVTLSGPSGRMVIRLTPSGKLP